MAYFYLTLVTVYQAVTTGQITFGKAAAWFYGLIVGLFTFVLPGFAISGYVSQKVLNWAIKRLANQLTEQGRRTLEETMKRMLWAKAFVVVCFVLLVGGFIFCYLNAL
jgi:hypothetical protein